ncbi:MAG: histidine--tRNA ligase, partial [Acidimicrobiales bacterium]|nr:histidine--tRNA ligase [Acidimicrobiales bacterium]
MSFQAPIGTRDIFAPESKTIGTLIAKFASLVELAGFELLISPLFEEYEVFARSAGQATDVVSKEMYVFTDRGGREMALRPEGTASVVRAFIQHQNPTPFKAWYATPAFRYEKPQAGRYRQHHQLGLEVIGSASPSCDIEIIELATSFLNSLGISNFTLLVNSMGDENCRPKYREALLDYLESKKTELCQDHQDRFKLNPLRVLDCKKPECISATKDAPMIDTMLCAECSIHHQEVLKGLSHLGIMYQSAPRLVRGFDYYTKTTFEIQSNSLDSSQNAIGGGGRYDKLVEKLGGREGTP